MKNEPISSRRLVSPESDEGGNLGEGGYARVPDLFTLCLGFAFSKSNKVVNSQQGQAVSAYKKKHSANGQKFFFVQKAHDFNETRSTITPLAPPLLKAPPNPGKAISRSEPDQQYEEDRSDY